MEFAVLACQALAVVHSLVCLVPCAASLALNRMALSRKPPSSIGRCVGAVPLLLVLVLLVAGPWQAQAASQAERTSQLLILVCVRLSIEELLTREMICYRERVDASLPGIEWC